MKKMNKLWPGVLLGLIITASGILKLVTGVDGELWGVNVPASTGWLLVPGGVFIITLALCGILRGEGKHKVPTDEDIANARAALEKMYLKEHGTLPEYPDKGQNGNGSGESKAAKTQ